MLLNTYRMLSCFSLIRLNRWNEKSWSCSCSHKIQEQFFCVQRGEHKYDYLSYKFEFPGGKLENNETPKEALIREIREELDYSIKVGKQLVIVNHQYPHFQLRMSAYLCHASDTNFVLKEHVQHK